MDRTALPWNYQAIDGDLLVTTGKGMLHSVIVCGPPGTDGAVTMYDGVDNAGTVISTFTFSVASSISVQPITLLFDVGFDVGLYFDYDGTVVIDLTATYV